jgi:hypothetical protein
MTRSRLAFLAVAIAIALTFVSDGHAEEAPKGVASITITYPRAKEGHPRFVAPGEWVPYHCSVATPYRGGKVLEYGNFGGTMSVSIDGGPPQPMRITVHRKEGMDALRAALDQGARAFTVTTSGKTLAELPILPAGRDIALVTSTPEDLSLLKRQTGITGLMLYAKSQDAVEALAALPDLTSLRLHCNAPCSLEPLTRLRKLRWLRLWGTADLAPLARVPSLRGLRLRVSDKEVDLRPVGQLRDLVALDLTYCKTVADLAPLAGLTRLEKLALARTAVADLAPLAQMTRLRSLDLARCTEIERLDPLARLSALAHLDLSGCAGVTDLSPLAELIALRRVELDGCKGVTNLAPLAAIARRGAVIKVDTPLKPQLATLADEADF